ncbi:MAG: choice-of-anchor tandem repeat GloVer-containing protein [Rhizomicrobium sp.]
MLFFRNFAVLCGTLTFLSLTLCAHEASAAHYKPKTLHSFCDGAQNCPDGRTPNAALVMDSAGNLFGTASQGGSVGAGTVFELQPNQERTKWKFRVIHDFCPDLKCNDGEQPQASPLIRDVAGNLYGEALRGGSTGGGVVFRLSPSATGNKWKFKALYNFGSEQGDGSGPTGGLTYVGAATGALYDGVSTLFGTTQVGGNAMNAGTVFALSQGSGEKSWSESVLFAFCSQDQCIDGKTPAGVVANSLGVLFGTTSTNIFQLSQTDGVWSETVLHSFCSEANCADGANSLAPPVIDASGYLYGTTSEWGLFQNAGVVFKLIPNGTSSQYSVIYSFCPEGCSQGSMPFSGVVLDSSGDLFGTATQSEKSGCVFEIKDGSYKMIYSFSGDDGASPEGGLLLDSSGDIFGTTFGGGASGEGTVFELRR